jgi:hypothetical protein
MAEFAEKPGMGGQNLEFTPLTLEEKDRFDAAKGDDHQYDLTRSLLERPDFAPRHVLI